MNCAKVRGFSMLELMVVVAISAIGLAVGVPSFQSLIASQRLKAAATNLQTYLNLTRAEALKRNATVTLSPNVSTDWATGWKIVDPVTGGVLFTASALPLSITGPTSVKFRNSGRIDAAADGKFQFSATGTSELRCVEIDLSGISMVTKGACS